MRKRKIRVLARKEDAGQGPNFEGGDFIPGPKLRAKFGISAVTLWRWRHEKENRFPAAKMINGRLSLSPGRRYGLAGWTAQRDVSDLVYSFRNNPLKGNSDMERNITRVSKLTPPPALDTNPFLEAANEAGSELGLLLKFVKGKYEVGDDEVPLGTQFVAHIDQLARGWVKFIDGQVADRRIGMVADGYKLPAREELGDTDETRWEKDSLGKPRDPWVVQWYLALTRVETGELLTFVTGTKGGISAIGALCRVYARKYGIGVLPIVALRVRSYKHKLFGRIETPDLEIVGWDGVPAQAVAQSYSPDEEIPF